MRFANDNAKHAFNEKRRASDDVQERLAQLKERLRLPTVPRRIECCDISHLGGTGHRRRGRRDARRRAGQEALPHVPRARRRGAKAAAKATDGAPTPGRAAEEDVDGMPVSSPATTTARCTRSSRAASVAASRRGARAAADGEGEAATERRESEWDLPDLFVVDGGEGQLAVALAAARDLGLHELPIVALAKEKENILGETLVDRVYLPGQKNPIPLKSHSASMFFLARVRDEAHRFSNRARERLGKKKRIKSALDDVAGLGPNDDASAPPCISGA